jgi:hypothetical protein
MIAKCGDERVHHWAHRGERVCDSWWERETEWHRRWKGKFPDDWQEVIRFAPHGEKHIADVHTSHGVTIEFQHSALRPDERAAREGFYENMLWVVDGSRLKRDLPRFVGERRSFREILAKGLYVNPFPDEAFPRSWLNCSVPVLFDFENAVGVGDEVVDVARALWCLLPGRIMGRGVVVEVGREAFVRWIHETAQPIPTRMILENVGRLLRVEHEIEEAKL